MPCPPGSFEAFKIQFYSNPSGEEGKRFIGEKTVVALVGGQVSFTFTPSPVLQTPVMASSLMRRWR